MEPLMDKMWGIMAALLAGLLAFARAQYMKLDGKVETLYMEHNLTKIDLATSKTLIKELTKDVQDLKETLTEQNKDIMSVLSSLAGKKRR